MLTQWTRVIFSNNGVLTDFTLAAQNSDTIPLAMVSAEDSLYIGQHFPFNNFFLDINTVNTNAAELDIEIWQNTQFINAVDTLDGTRVSGVTLARSENVVFSPDRDESWELVEDTSEDSVPPELKAGTPIYYNLYWMRIRVTADLDVGTVLNKFGYRFADGALLSAVDPDIDKYLESWKAGKTDWDEQLQLASERVISDMKARGIIVHPGEILLMDELAWATAYKALHIIYMPLGPDFNERKVDADKAYRDIMDAQRFTIDTNRNAAQDIGEIQNKPSGQLVR